VHRRYYRRFPNSDWITPDVFAKKRWIKGVVTSVGDADNFRLYHTPGLGWSLPLKLRFIPSKSKDLKDQTLHIRMAGIDAPEAAHFGKPAQPFAEEALAWLKGRVEGKTVYCQLISRDQYSRVVAVPMLPPRILPAFLTPRFGRCLSLEMLRDGWAVTYEQAGAVYGKWGKEHFVELETKAKAARRGQWASGAPSESPAAYKRRYATAQTAKSESEPAANVVQDREKAAGTQVPEKRRWFGWLRRK